MAMTMVMAGKGIGNANLMAKRKKRCEAFYTHQSLYPDQKMTMKMHHFAAS